MANQYLIYFKVIGEQILLTFIHDLLELLPLHIRDSHYFLEVLTYAFGSSPPNSCNHLHFQFHILDTLAASLIF